MLILGIESSCDETSVSVCEAGETIKVLSNITVSQIDIHKLYGGVVPEIASRAHIEAISGITYEALEKASVKLSDIDAIGVTYNPGLIGALLVGVNFAKSLAYANNIPLVPVNHIKAHVAANYFTAEPPKPPFTALVASGGHTSLMKVESYTDYKLLGATRDDAIGEAFDKVARVMGIPYPGGAVIDNMAYQGNGKAIKFPSASIEDGTLDFSFSGLKTAVVNYIHNAEQKGSEYVKEDVAASFTKTVVDSVMKKLTEVISKTGTDKIVIAGGVAANKHLRERLEAFGKKNGISIYMPERQYCGDNGAMVASQAYFEYRIGNLAGTDLNAIPS